MEADRFNHNFVGTEHLLLGLLKLGQGVAVNVLQKMGLDLETVRSEIEKQVGTGPDQKMIGNIPYTPRVKKVLVLAAKEAKALNHTYVGTEHILLGLLREGDGVAGRVLKNLEVDIEVTRQEILKELDPNFALDYSQAKPAAVDKAATNPEGKKPETTTTGRPQIEGVDLTKRYDVYCSERLEQVVVYRNVLFKGVKRLLPEDRDALADFYELEQADGQSVFVAKYSVIKFCEPGGTPNAENIPGKQP
jgi:ATP-dependent Clp protease ATP-binding subunit ClpA